MDTVAKNVSFLAKLSCKLVLMYHAASTTSDKKRIFIIKIKKIHLINKKKYKNNNKIN